MSDELQLLTCFCRQYTGQRSCEMDILHFGQNLHRTKSSLRKISVDNNKRLKEREHDIETQNAKVIVRPYCREISSGWINHNRHIFRGILSRGTLLGGTVSAGFNVQLADTNKQSSANYVLRVR